MEESLNQDTFSQLKSQALALRQNPRWVDIMAKAWPDWCVTYRETLDDLRAEIHHAYPKVTDNNIDAVQAGFDRSIRWLVQDLA